MSLVSMDNPEYLHRQAYDWLMGQMQTGKLKPGSKLPGERALAEFFEISRGTVRNTLAGLEREGLIERVPSRGAFVRSRDRVNEVTPAQTATQVAVIFPRWMMDSSQVADDPLSMGISPQHPMTNVLLSGVLGAFDQQQYHVTPLFYRNEYLWLDAGQVACRRGCQGALVLAASQCEADDFRRMMDAGMKIVLLDRHSHLGGLGLTQVWRDTDAVLAEALEGLIKRGHRRITVVRYRLPAGRMVETLAAFDQKYGLSLVDSFVEIPNATGQVPEYDVVEQVLDRRDCPTAMIVPDEFAASVAFRGVQRRGLQVPRDLSLAALTDNLPQSHPVPLTAPDTTKFHLSVAEAGAKHLTRLLAGEALPAMSIRVRSEMQWRASTGPCPERAGTSVQN